MMTVLAICLNDEAKWNDPQPAVPGGLRTRRGRSHQQGVRDTNPLVVIISVSF